MKLHDEVFSLASELVRRFSNKDKHKCNLAFQKVEFMGDEDFVYQLPETPRYLERIGLAEILSDDLAFVSPDYWVHKNMGVMGVMYKPKNGAERTLGFQNSLSRKGINVPGFYAMSFDVQALHEWYDNELSDRVGINEGVIQKVPEGWKWLDEKKGIYQFGSLGRFDEGRGKIAEIFHEAMNLFHETPQAISIQSLSKRTDVSPKSLRSRLHELNKKLSKMNLRLVGSGEGYYRIEST
jgi:hypothetical protein